MGMAGQRHAPAALPQGNDPVSIVLEAGWTPGPIWTGAENLASTGIRLPDRPARSEFLRCDWFRFKLSLRVNEEQIYCSVIVNLGFLVKYKLIPHYILRYGRGVA